MSSLTLRLSIALLLLLTTATGFILWITHRSNSEYILEFTQSLNQPIAMYMADNAGLSVEDRLDNSALRELAPHIMMINPSVEVYLLDRQGFIVGHSLSPEALARTRVSLAPIEQFLGPNPRFPLIGDDPRSINGQRVFSAHPLKHESETIGYVYAVLAGLQHRSLLASLSGSYSFKTLTISLGVVLLLTVAASIALFSMQSRRLAGLHHRLMQWHQQQGLDPMDLSNNQFSGAASELDQLQKLYELMASRVLEQYRELQRTETNRKELFENLSHDLRTPLTALNGFLDTLVMKHQTLGTSEQFRYLKVAQRQGQRLSQLVEHLFELVRLDTGDYPFYPEQLLLRELADDVMQNFEATANRKSIRLSFEADHQTASTAVCADAGLMYRVLENLLANAIRHTPEHGHIMVVLSTDPTNSTLTLAVTDSGPGLATDLDQAHLFERFARYPSSSDALSTDAASTGPTASQSGLGLAIVRGILKLHNSDITVQSIPDQGCTFQFSLQAEKLNRFHAPAIELTGDLN